MRYSPSLLLLLFSFLGCQTRQQEPAIGNAKKDPQVIIDKAIARHGGDRFATLRVAFDFRDRHYEAVRQNGQYRYTRSFTDSTGRVQDVLTNESFTRTINGQGQNLPAERVKAFTASVNSVIYFALLPFGLNDPAVQKEFIGVVTIGQNPYDKIKITFKQEGGGEDFQDEFLYYIHQQSGTLDYFAYTYATDGGGIRFRRAIHPREIKGIRFQDYINYEPVGAIDFNQIEQVYEAGQLQEFSRIALENIRVLAP